jgi:hypothetical protein
MPMMARTSHYGNFDLAQLVFFFSLAYSLGQFTAGSVLSASCAAAMERSPATILG